VSTDPSEVVLFIRELSIEVFCMLTIISGPTFFSCALPRMVISSSFGSLRPSDDETEESAYPSDTFFSVATSTSFANYFPVDEDTNDDFLEPHEPKKELINDGLLIKDDMLANDGLWELVLDQSPFCF